MNYYSYENMKQRMLFTKLLAFGMVFIAAFSVSKAQNYWELNGNTNLQSTNFLGTTSNVPLRFKSSNTNRHSLHIIDLQKQIDELKKGKE